MSWRRRLFAAVVIALPGVAALAFGASSVLADGSSHCETTHAAADHGDCQRSDRNHDRDDRPSPTLMAAPPPAPSRAPVVVPARAPIPARPAPIAVAAALVAPPPSPTATATPAPSPTPTRVGAPREISLPLVRSAPSLLDSTLTRLLVVAVVVGAAAGTVPHIVGRRR